MNRLLKISLDGTDEDREVVKELIKEDKELQKHFFNVAMYIGPRYFLATAKIFRVEEALKHDRSSLYPLFRAVHYPLSEKDKDKLLKIWDQWNRRYVLTEKHKRGVGYSAAVRSFKIIMEL